MLSLCSRGSLRVRGQSVCTAARYKCLPLRNSIPTPNKSFSAVQKEISGSQSRRASTAPRTPPYQSQVGALHQPQHQVCFLSRTRKSAPSRSFSTPSITNKRDPLGSPSFSKNSHRSNFFIRQLKQKSHLTTNTRFERLFSQHLRTQTNGQQRNFIAFSEYEGATTPPRTEYPPLKPVNQLSREIREQVSWNVSNSHFQEILLKFERNIERHLRRTPELPLENPFAVFTNSEVNFSLLKVLGFDYDYTIAPYNVNVQHFIYNGALQFLIKDLHYPSGLEGHKYDPNFAIRGLHFDTRRGNLVKLNAFRDLQYDAVFFGRKRLSKEEALKSYPGFNVSKDDEQASMKSLSDLFSLPEATLISDVIQYFNDHGITFEPSILHRDMQQAIKYVHKTVLHPEIMKNPQLYLDHSPGLIKFLDNLRSCDKKSFLLTNSPFPFVNAGMNFLFAGNPKPWTDYFDIIICNASKPNFYTHDIAFRKYENETITWDRVTAFEKDKIYYHGSLSEMKKITGWEPEHVLYFGDHLFNDILKPSNLGWKTGSIIAEIEREVEIQNSLEYRTNLAELLEVERILKAFQVLTGPDRELVLTAFSERRMILRSMLRKLANNYFGSSFRTHTAPTLYAFSFHKLSDIYTSRLENLSIYPLDKCVFYPSRSFAPHECKIPSMNDIIQVYAP